MRKELKLIFQVLVSLLICSPALADPRYWVATAASNWSNSANWSAASHGSPGASVPGSADLVYFDGSSNKTCTLDNNITIARIETTSFTGKIEQSTKTLTVSGDAVFAGGIFNGSSSAAITISGSMTISGMAFTSTGGTLTVAGGFTISSGSFTHNNGKLTLSAPQNFTVSNTGGTSFYRLSFAPSSASAYSITSTTAISVNRVLSYDGSASVVLNSGTIGVKGNLLINNTSTGGGGSTVISMNGTADTLTGASTSGQGTVSNLTFANGASVANYIITSGKIITVKGTLATTGSAQQNFNGGGTINALGAVTIGNSGTGGGGDAIINFGGSVQQVFSGNGSTLGLMPKVTINKTGDTLKLSGAIGCANDWTYVQGIVNAISGTSTVAMSGNHNLDGQGSSTTMKFYKVSTQSGTTTLTGNLLLDNNLTLMSGTSLAGNGFDINAGGSWDNQGATWTPGAGTVTFEGTTYKTVKKSGGETFGNLALNKSNGLQLLSPVTVTGTLTLTNGRIKTTTTNYFNLASGASVSGGSNTAYVNGPMRKTGNTAFTFPLGDSAVASTPYHPFGITAPASSTDAYEAQYKGTGQTSGSTKASTIAALSSCEYWTLQRIAPASGTTTITPTLNWNANCSNVNYSDMVVAAWNGTQWNDQSAGTLNATAPAGSIKAGTALSFTNATTVVPVLIASKVVNRSYATLKKQLDGGYFNITGNILYFRFDEEYKDADAKLSYRITDLRADTLVPLMSNSTTTNVPVSYGNNAYKMDLYSAPNTPLTSGMYLVEVTNEKNETWYLRIKI